MPGFRRGELILFSKPYVHVLSSEFRGKRCDFCFSKRNDLKRCSQCTFMYFCNKECQKESWEMHKEQCKFIKDAHPNKPTPFILLCSQVLLKIKKFGMDQPYENVHDIKMTFESLMSHAKEFEQDAKTREQIIVTRELLKIFMGENEVPPFSEFLEISGKLRINSFSILDSEMNSIGVGIYLGASKFDHSCEPDAEVIFNGINLSIRALHDIPHRDITKIFINYISLLMLTEERQNLLKESYYFTCQCARCTLPYYDDLMKKILTKDSNCDDLIEHLKEELIALKEMRKNQVSWSLIFERSLKALEEVEGILGETNIYRIRIMEFALDACIQLSKWPEARAIGIELIQPYKLLCYPYHPSLGFHLYKIGKIESLLNLLSSAVKNLIQAEEIIKVVYSCEHPLYQDLLELLNKCQIELAISNNCS